MNMYAPLVRPGGLIALHDIHGSVLVPSSQCHVYWREAKRRYRTVEFIADRAKGAGMGIGVIFLLQDGSWAARCYPASALSSSISRAAAGPGAAFGSTGSSLSKQSARKSCAAASDRARSASSGERGVHVSRCCIAG